MTVAYYYDDKSMIVMNDHSNHDEHRERMTVRAFRALERRRLEAQKNKPSVNKIPSLDPWGGVVLGKESSCDRVLPGAGKF